MTCYKTDNMKQQNNESRKVEQKYSSLNKNINVIIAARKNGTIFTIVCYLSLPLHAVKDTIFLVFIIRYTKRKFHGSYDNIS